MVLFYLLSLLGLLSFILIHTKNPVHSVLSLICIFLLSSILLLSLKVEFLAISFVIIYVGAIAILFLFVVMMLDIKIRDHSLDIFIYGPLGYFIVAIFFLEFLLPLTNVSSFSENVFSSTWVNWFAEMDAISNTQSLGQLLYTYYFACFLMAGFILLISLLGALMLTQTLSKPIKGYTYYKKNVLMKSRKY
jgi:NADH-quinone oxidoreductase subunit J